MEETPMYLIIGEYERIKVHLAALEKVEKIGGARIIHLISAPLEDQSPAAILFLEKTANDFQSIGIQRAPQQVLDDLIKLDLINRTEPVIERRDIERAAKMVNEFCTPVDKPVKQADKIPVPKFYKRNRFTR